MVVKDGLNLINRLPAIICTVNRQIAFRLHLLNNPAESFDVEGIVIHYKEANVILGDLHRVYRLSLEIGFLFEGL